ncbi:uncharacterized protein LOC107635182 isoform X1 [Arachis ipaensis]|uniref:uncharacterized protein LOC107635182 isoform X1 n=1 Tax=Arachis ipaensis TaxID=130454 RepID=UPI000A2B2094|nr:uncharacterized protein LOC107635182 isoform X1 [Arachis ipaensis]
MTSWDPHFPSSTPPWSSSLVILLVRDSAKGKAASTKFTQISSNGAQSIVLCEPITGHTHQLCFFEKAVKSLETVEPHVKSVTELQHIDYRFNGLEEELNHSKIVSFLLSQNFRNEKVKIVVFLFHHLFSIFLHKILKVERQR